MRKEVGNGIIERGPARRGARAAAHPRRPAQPARRAAHDRRPGAGARRGRCGCSTSGDPLGYTAAPGILELREAIAGHHRRTSRHRRRPRRRRRHDRLSGGFLLAFLAAFEAGDRVAMARPGLPLLPQRADRAGLRGGRDPDRPGDALPADGRAAGGAARRHGLTGLVRRHPGQPDRHDAAARASSPRSRAWCEEQRVQLVSDEIYHGIEYAPPTPSSRAAPGRPREAVVVRLVLEVLLDDRLADRLDAGPGAAAPAPVDVLTGNFTICPPVLAQRAASRRSTDASYAELDGHVRALRRQPAAPARRPAPARHRPSSPRPTAPSTSTPTSGT